MRIEDTKLHGVRLLVPDVFTDDRGSYCEIYDTENYREACGGLDFVQDDISISKERVLRGVHGDYATTKLVSVLHGEGYALLADNRPDSPTFKQWQSFTLSDANRNQLLIPAGIGNSVVAMRGPLVYWYKQTTHFEPGRQFTILWNDPEWGFDWPIDDPILSERDRRGGYVTAS